MTLEWVKCRRAPAHLPDAFVRLRPDALEVREERVLQRPAGFARGEAVAARLMERIHHLAEHVELQLAVGGIADAHRLGAFVARQPGHLPFGQPPLAADPVHDLDLLRTAGHRAQQPLAPGLRLVVEAGIHQREQGQASRRAASRSDSPSCAPRPAAPAARSSARRRCRRSASRCSALSVISERTTASEQCPDGRHFFDHLARSLGRGERRAGRAARGGGRCEGA